jgi:hypothetical protein
LAIAVVVGCGYTSAQNTVVATRGKEFWLGFMQNHGTAADLKVLVSSNQNTNGTIGSPLAGWSQAFTVVAGVATELAVPGSYMHLGSEQIEAKGVLVETDDTVSVQAFSVDTGNTAASLILAKQALGTRYRAVAYNGYPGSDTNTAELLIIATEDGTEVEITPACLTLGGQPAGVAFTVTLERGASLQVKAATGSEDLTGTLIRGTQQGDPCRPFAVFSGSVCPYIPGGVYCPSCDQVFEQDPPAVDWGMTYHLAPWYGTTSYTYRVLADVDGTSITIDSGAPIYLNAGDYFDVNQATAPSCFSGNLPFCVAQFMQGGFCSGDFGDPSMLILHADDQEVRAAYFAVPFSEYYTITDHTINVIVDGMDTANVLLDGSLVPPSTFMPFPACTDKFYAQISVTSSDHQVSCPNGFLGYLYGAGHSTYESYALSLGATFPVDPLCTPLAIAEPRGPSGHLVLDGNPTTGFFSFFTQAHADARYEVYDTRGIIVRSGPVGNHDTQVDMSHAPAGLYVLRVNGTYTKVIVAR